MIPALTTQHLFDPSINSIAGTAVWLGGIIGGTVAFFRGLAEYRRKNRLQRYDSFIAQRKEFEATSKLTDVYVAILLGPEHDVSQFPVWDRIYFLVFLENIAIMMNSGLISTNVVHNTWGFGILQCWKNRSFWKDIDEHWNDKNKRSRYWRVFYQLHSDMKEIDDRVRENPSRVTHYRF